MCPCILRYSLSFTQQAPVCKWAVKTTGFIFHLLVTEILQEILSFVCGLTHPPLFFADKWNTRITDLRKEVEELFEKRYGMCYAPFQAIPVVLCHGKWQTTLWHASSCWLRNTPELTAPKGKILLEDIKLRKIAFLMSTVISIWNICVWHQSAKLDFIFQLCCVSWSTCVLTCLGHPHLRELSFSLQLHWILKWMNL